MSEVIDKPDALSKAIVANAIKSAQDFARKNAEEPDNWLVNWTLYCGPRALQTVVSKAKKTGENEWESIEQVVFQPGSACLIAAQPQWVQKAARKIDLRTKIGGGYCVSNIVIRKWSLSMEESGEAVLRVDMDGDVPR